VAVYEWNGKSLQGAGVGTGVYVARVAGVKAVKFVKW
jgi:hypothetical protein